MVRRLLLDRGASLDTADQVGGYGVVVCVCMYDIIMGSGCPPPDLNVEF